MTSQLKLTLIILCLLVCTGCTLHIGVSFDSDEELDGTEITKLIEEN